MENYFKPVHGPSMPGENKPRKHHHQSHHLNHNQDPQSHRYTMFDESDRNTDDSQGHNRRHRHGHYFHNNPHHGSHRRHQTQQFNQSEEDEILYKSETPIAISRALSSSLSSSDSSSSFSSWYTEESANEPFSLRHAQQPQHSLSCSNIAEMRRALRDDDGSEPIVFATVKHGKEGSISSDTHEGTNKKGRSSFSSLDRCHSRSAGLLQGNESDVAGERSREQHREYGTLYKTASLNRSLAFSEENIVLGVSMGPKRAVSSSQLPSKGILKNKEPRNDIRKAKSMEVLSPRVSKGQDPSGQKGKGITQVEMEQARANFVQGKLQFSAFLDEITKQVISPSDLTILGLNKNKPKGKTPAPAETPGPVKPQLPPKKHRQSSGEERAQHPIQHGRPEKAGRSSSGKDSDGSNPDKIISYADKKHHGSPPPHHYDRSPSHRNHYGGTRKDRRLSPTGGSMSGERYGTHFTDGTSTSPEPIPPKQRHHRKQQPTTSQGKHTQHYPQNQAHPGPVHRGPTCSPPSSAKGVEPGLGSESSSSKSDSSRTRDTASTATSHSSEQSGRHHSQHEGHTKQRRETLCDADHLRALQEENSDLHQNLLQTVVCIESLEVELQRTRDELSGVKEKYKSLLETHSGTKQANSLLGEHLHIASESLSSERKYLLNRVSQLSSELEDAHRTMAALENINVSCLIKELLEKHFSSAESIQKLLMASSPNSHCVNSPKADSQSNTAKVEDAALEWLTKSEASPPRVTAFSPFKQEVPTAGNESSLSSQHESRHSPPFSVNDISTAIYKKMAASYAARPRPVYPQSQQQPPVGTNHADPAPKLQQAHVGADSWVGNGGVKVTLVEDDVVDVDSVSAQQILDDFMEQLQARKEVGGGKEQQGGQEWAGGAEQTGRVAD